MARSEWIRFRVVLLAVVAGFVFVCATASEAAAKPKGAKPAVVKVKRAALLKARSKPVTTTKAKTKVTKTKRSKRKTKKAHRHIEIEEQIFHHHPMLPMASIDVLRLRANLALSRLSGPRAGWFGRVMYRRPF